MKKSKLWSLLLTFGAIGLAIGGANLKHAPNVFAHHEDNITHEVEGHSKVRPTLSPEKLDVPAGHFGLSTKADVIQHFNGTGEASGRNLFLTNDIDMEGTVFPTDIRIHGEYSKIFEGNGFTISNFKAGQMFHIIGGSGEIRNANFRYTLGFSSTALCYQNNGLIENVKIEYTIDAVRDHIGGFSRIGGSGEVKNSQVDFIFEGAGTGSVTNLMAVSYQGSLSTTNCSYYESVDGKIQAQGLTKRSEQIEWGGVIPPRVSVVAGYVNKIYVQEEPKSTQITAEILNTEETPVWSIAELVGETFGEVEIDEEGVVTVKAVAKGTISFKIKATIDGEDYLSSLVTIKVLNNSTEYDVPENAHEIKDRASFEAFFQGSGVNNNENAYLSADVDLGGKSFTLGMAGNFSGILEGQGYKIYNYTANRLFENTTATSEIRNLTIAYTTAVVTGSAGVAYNNGGLIKNVKAMITVSQGVHTYAGMSLIGSGTFENCHTDFIVKSTNSHTLYPISQDDHARNLIGCTWTMNGAADTVMFLGSNPNKTRDVVREGALGFQLLVMGYEGGDIATEECAAKWEAANIKWNAISADSRAQVRTDAEFEDAWLRYQHWALANGSTPDAGVGSGLNTNNNLNLTATIIIGAIGLTTLVGYYFINKKKAHA